MAEPRPTPLPFHVALQRERIRYQTSARDVADGIGVSVDEYKAYEDGRKIPTRDTFRRLAGRWPRMRASRPAWSLIAVSDIETTPIVDERPLPAPPPVQTFGAALRRVREDNGVTQDQLGEIIGVTGQAISEWEADNAAPVGDNLSRLYEVVWELRVAVDCGAAHPPRSQDIPIPDGGRGQSRVVVNTPPRADVGLAISMAMAQSDDEAGAAPSHAAPRSSARDWMERLTDHSTPDIRLHDTPPAIDPLADIREAGATIAIATLEKTEAEIALATTRATITKLEKTVEDAQCAIDAATQKLHLAIERKTRV